MEDKRYSKDCEKEVDQTLVSLIHSDPLCNFSDPLGGSKVDQMDQTGSENFLSDPPLLPSI